MTRVKLTLLIALTTVTLTVTAACSGTEPGRPTAGNPTSDTAETTSTTPPSGQDLDLSKFTSDPCRLLTASQLAQLGTFKAPEQWKAPLGPGCRWNAKEVTEGVAYSVALSTKGNTLESMIANARTEPVFREATVAGYPAFSSDGTNGKGTCSTYVGTSNKDAVVVQINTLNENTPEYKDSCGATEKVAALVIQNLRG